MRRLPKLAIQGRVSTRQYANAVKVLVREGYLSLGDGYSVSMTLRAMVTYIGMQEEKPIVTAEGAIEYLSSIGHSHESLQSVAKATEFDEGEGSLDRRLVKEAPISGKEEDEMKEWIRQRAIQKGERDEKA